MILIAALAVSTLMLQSVDWFARFPSSVALCYDETLQLCHLSPWHYTTFTRSEMLRLLVQRVASEIGVLVSCLLSSLVPSLLIIRLRRPDAVAPTLGAPISATGRPEVMNELYAAYDRLTPYDLKRVASRYLIPTNETVITLETEKTQ
jgi:hypothetical protein